MSDLVVGWIFRRDNAIREFLLRISAMMDSDGINGRHTMYLDIKNGRLLTDNSISHVF